MEFTKLQEIIAQGLNVEEEEVTMDADFTENLGADSLDLFELVMDIEEHFGVNIPNEQLSEMKQVKDVAIYITQHQ